jgi:hypothetical protein
MKKGYPPTARQPRLFYRKGSDERPYIRAPKTLFAVFLIGIVAAAQTPTPADQARQIELQKEYLRLSAARSSPVLIGFPTVTPLHPAIIMQPPLKKMENK